MRQDFYTGSIVSAKFVSKEQGLSRIEISRKRKWVCSACCSKKAGKSLKYIRSGCKIQKFKINYLPFYSKGLRELEASGNLFCWREREQNRARVATPLVLMYEAWHPEGSFMRNSETASKILSCCMLLLLFSLGTCQMSLNQWSSLSWKATSAKMDKVLLLSITAGKLRVKYISKPGRGRQQNYAAVSKGRMETDWGRELDELFQS